MSDKAIASTYCKSESNAQLSLQHIQTNAGSSLDCYVSHTESLNEFYVQPAKYEADLDKVLENMSRAGSNPAVLAPSMGQFCCAKFSEDEQWYRGEIIGQSGDKFKVGSKLSPWAVSLHKSALEVFSHVMNLIGFTRYSSLYCLLQSTGSRLNFPCNENSCSRNERSQKMEFHSTLLCLYKPIRQLIICPLKSHCHPGAFAGVFDFRLFKNQIRPKRKIGIYTVISMTQYGQQWLKLI